MDGLSKVREKHGNCYSPFDDGLRSLVDLFGLEVVGLAEGLGRLFDRLDRVDVSVDVGLEDLVFLEQVLDGGQVAAVVLRLQLQLHVVDPAIDVIQAATEQ